MLIIPMHSSAILNHLFHTSFLVASRSCLFSKLPQMLIDTGGWHQTVQDVPGHLLTFDGVLCRKHKRQRSVEGDTISLANGEQTSPASSNAGVSPSSSFGSTKHLIAGAPPLPVMPCTFLLRDCSLCC